VAHLPDRARRGARRRVALRRLESDRRSLVSLSRSQDPVGARAYLMAVALPAGRRITVPGRGVASVIREVARRPAGRFGLFVIVALIAIVAFTPWISPYDPSSQHIVDRLQGPSWHYPLGTDDLGRDLLSRIFYGTRVALGVAFPAVVGALLLGMLLGTVAGYAGGKIDNALIVVFDTLQAFPAVILALALISLLGP